MSSRITLAARCAALLAIALFTELTLSAQTCPEISTLSCTDIEVDLPLSLTFDGTEGGLPLRASNTLGFTMAQAPSARLTDPALDGPPSNPSVPGFEPAKLAIGGSKLTITSNNGLFYSQPSGTPSSTRTNSQINALGVGFAPISDIISITATLDQPDFSESAGDRFQQTGLWYGLDEDNALKLAVNKANSAGTEQHFELLIESTNGPNTLDIRSIKTGRIPVDLSATISLRMEIDPVTLTAIGFYSIDGGPEVRLLPTAQGDVAGNTLPIPQSFLNGTDHDASPATSPLTFAGVYASHRRAGGNQSFDAVYDSFAVITSSNTPAVVNDATFDVSEGEAAGAVIGNVIASDADANDAVSLSITNGNGQGLFAINPTTGELTLRVGSLDAETTTRYTLTISGTDGKQQVPTEATVTVNVTNVEEPPITSLSANPTEGTAPLSVTFDASESSGPEADDVLTYTWDFGDRNSGANNTATGADAQHTYNSGGAYTARLTVDDGTSTSTQSILIIVNEGNRSAGCTPISTLDCADIAQPLPIELAFDSEQTGIPAGAGGNTGFTMVLNPSNRLPEDGPVFDNNVPGYEPNELEVNDGQLLVTSHKGILFSQPAGTPSSTETNSQINALGTGFVAPGTKFSITATVDAIDFSNTPPNGSQQGGIWFGLDEDRYFKLATVERANQAEQHIQLVRENLVNGVESDIVEVNPPKIVVAGVSKIRLRMEIDPTTNKVAGYYQLDDAAEVKIASAEGFSDVGLPTSFLTGVDHDNDAATAPLSYAGVFATHRRAEPSQTIEVAFNDFTVREESAAPSFTFGQASIDATVLEGEAPSAVSVALTTTDGSTPTASFIDDPDASEWLILPAPQAPGQVSFAFRPGLPPGNYSTTVFATADDYESAGIPISLIVNPLDSDGTWKVSTFNIVTDEVTQGNPEGNLSVTVTNTSNEAINGIAASVSGRDAAVYTIDEAAVPTDLAGGGSFTIDIDFDPEREGAHLASLNLSAANAGSVVISMSGLGKDGEGGANEPSLQYIFDTHRLPINVGDQDPSTNRVDRVSGTTYNSVLGDEVRVPLFERVGEEVVTVEVLAVFGPEAADPIVEFGYYPAGSPAATTEIFSVGNGADRNGQTLTPTIDGKLIFDPGAGSFGFYSKWPFFDGRQINSEDPLNTFTDAIPHHVRVYELPGEENAYVIATEEHTSGFDYQDVVVIARNVRPASSTQVADAIRVNFSDQASPVVLGYYKDFGEPFGDRGDFAYGWIVPGTTAPLNLVGNGRNRPPTPDDDAREETLMHLQYGDVNGSNGIAAEGAWEIAIPNGAYDVTVVAGDRLAESFVGTNHVVRAEGVVVINNAATINAPNRFVATKTVEVRDGRLTIDAAGGTNTKVIYLTLTPVSGDPVAVFADPTPSDEASGVEVVDFQISVDAVTSAGYSLDRRTLTGNVKLFERTADGRLVEVPSNSNDTGGNDAVTLTPLTALKYSTDYVFRIDGVEAFDVSDVDKRIQFEVFTSTFTTGELDDTNPPRNLEGVSFTKIKGSSLGAGVNARFTSLVVGPDNRLYASTTGEVIKRWDINPDGTLANLEELTVNLSGSNDPVTGTPLSDNRIIIGLVFDPASTADNLIAYVTHSSKVFNGGKAWDGKLTRLSGSNLEVADDIIEHLPRSTKDHLTNSVVFDPQGIMYLVQGSNSAGGAPDPNWNNRPERLLSAAVLRVDLSKLDQRNLPLSVYTTDDIQVINSAPTSSLLMSDGTYNPYGRNAPVTLFATGVRNAYDLVWHSNGWMYVPTNGTAGNNTTSPNAPASANFLAPGIGVRRPDGTFFKDGSIPALIGGETQKDWLFKTKGGSYHGHPNPYRGEFVLNHGGRPYAGLPGQANGFYTDVAKYPDDLGPDPNYLEVAYDFGRNKSPNGVIEYRSNAFQGKLEGMLMVVRFSGQDDVVVLEPGNNSGDIVTAYGTIPGLQGLDDPLDVIEDTRTGNLYVSEYDRDGGNNFGLTLLRADVPATLTAEIVATPHELLFEVTANSDGNRTATRTVNISNDGALALVINNVSISGPAAAAYSFTGPTSITLQPRTSRNYEVTFSPNAGMPHGYLEAALTFNSNANSNAAMDVGLHGLYKEGRQDDEEPTLQNIVDVLGIGIDVGWTTLTTDLSNSQEGDEVLVPLFEAAGPGSIGIEAVARYSGAGSAPFGWYTNLGGTVTRNEVGVQTGTQSLYPQLVSGVTSFNPQGAFFGLYVDSAPLGRINYTEDDLNVPTPSGADHRARVYPAKDRSGSIIANSYLVAFEEDADGDYQDYVFVVTNARPFVSRALTLSFLPDDLIFNLSPGSVSPPQQATLIANAGIDESTITLSTDAPWVVLPDPLDVGVPLDFLVNGFLLAEGVYEATITAAAPGFAPTELRILATVGAPSDFSVKINFQDASFDPPSDYQADTGEAYGGRGNGFSYGWVDPFSGQPSDNSARARGLARGVTNSSTDFDKLRRSYNMLDLVGQNVPHDWEIAIPNGTYDVELCVGDPLFFNSVHVVRVEGVTVIDGFDPTPQDYFREGSATVVVNDGKLTVDDVGATATGNSKINFINITPVVQTPGPTAIVDLEGRQNASGSYYNNVSVSLSATDDANTGGIASIRFSINGGRVVDYTTPFQMSLGSTALTQDFIIDVEVTDLAGNIGMTSEAFTVIRSTGAVVRYENMTKLPGTDRSFPAADFLTFNRVRNPLNSRGNPLGMQDENVLRIHNDGVNPLVITRLTTTNTNNFAVTGLSVPDRGLSVAPGSFVEATVTFVHNGGKGKRLVTEQLILESNAENASEVSATLRGAYMLQSEGNNEITAEQVFESFGWQTKMGRDANGNVISRPSSDYPTDEAVDAGDEGDMILSKFFVAADPSQPVRMVQIAALHGPDAVGTSLRTTSGGNLNFSYRHDAAWHQSLLPRLNGDTVLTTKAANISEPFLIQIASYRTTGGNSSGQSKDDILGVRIYRVIDRDGNPVPNEYIVNQDYIGNGCGAGSSNCDWNDNTAYIINARPLAKPSSGPIGDLTVNALTQEEYRIANSFDNGYPGNGLRFTAKLTNGSELPDWLILDELTGEFSINAPVFAGGQAYEIRVTATDFNQLQVSSNFTLNVNQTNFGCTVNANVDGQPKVLSCSTPVVRLSGFTSTGVYQWTGPNGFVSTQRTPSVSAPGTYTLTTDSGDPSAPCQQTDDIEVTQAPGTGNAGNGGELAVCSNEAAFDLFTALTSFGGDPVAGGTWTYDGAPVQSTFDPGSSPSGTYRYTTPAAGNCPAGTADLIITVSTAIEYYVDADGDGFGDDSQPSVFRCDAANGFATEAGDCDDTNPAVNPRGTEVCDNADNDCDGTVDNGLNCTTQNVFWLEAECALVGSKFTVESRAGYSGDMVYVADDFTTTSPPADLPENRVRFVIDNAEPDDYHLFTRVRGDFTRFDSYWVRVNGGPWLLYFWRNDDPSGLVWSEVSQGPFALTAGTNTVDFAYREQNTFLDKIHLNTNGSVPSGRGGEASNCGPVRDRDGDGVTDNLDNCPDTPNPDQADADGNGIGDVCDEPIFTSNEMWLEAECAEVGGRFVTEAHPAASNGEVVYLPGQQTPISPPADVPENRVRFTIDDAEPGDYHLFARVRGDFTLHDSYWVRVNGGNWIKWFWRVDADNGLVWSEVFTGPFAFSTGVNTVDFAYRERDVFLDKIHLNQTGILPTGKGEAATNCGAAGNRPPIAVAEFSTSDAFAPALVDLDASRSSDPDGDIRSYSWSINGGTAITGVNPSVTLSAGVYTAVLTVTDNLGGKDVDEVSFTISDDPGPAREAFTLEAECAEVGSNFVTQSHPSASNGDVVQAPDGFFTGSPPADVAANRVRFVIDNAVPGAYNLFARVRGDFTKYDSYWVRVNGGEWIKWFWRVDDPSGLVWSEVFDGPFTLTAGVNTIDFANREKLTFLDKIHLNRTGAIPTGQGPAATNCSSAAGRPAQFVPNKRSGIAKSQPALQPVVNAIETAISAELVAYPNPVRERMHFQLSGAYEGDVHASIISLDGKVVRQIRYDKVGKVLVGEFQTSDLPSGSYLLRVLGGTDVYQRTFVKIR